MITSEIYNWNEIGVTAETTSFNTENGITEQHAMIHVSPCNQDFAGQYARIRQGMVRLLSSVGMEDAKVVMKRYFLSDATNQVPLMEQETDCAISLIQQPPMDGSKIAAWMYIVHGAEVKGMNDDLNSTVMRHNGYEHIWTMGMNTSEGNSYNQTAKLLEQYEGMLAERGLNIADNCLRTWFFVRDVDTNYHGLVSARRENFTLNALRQDTHYISSTGIGGSPANTKALVQLETYAIKGLEQKQQRYLYALSHLNRTIEYGVTFERGTLIEYGDRKHALISGTASIDNKGEVLHVGDITKQTMRMWENVEALLNEADMSFDDVMQIIVYIRDTADSRLVTDLFRKRFPKTPFVITLAPVCRPTWLIEMECIAVANATTSFPNF